MPSFIDADGREWTIRFDGLNLAELRRAHGLNLADLTGADYFAIDRDPSLLTVAVTHLVKDQLAAAKVSRPQFAAALVGQALDDAQSALWEAARLFFPPRRLSELQSSYETLRGQWQALGPTLLLLGQPGIPATLTEALARSLTSQAPQTTSSTASPTSAASSSATGPAGSQPNAACGSPAIAESVPRD